MGYSCTAAASKTLELLMYAVKGNTNGPTNSWTFDGENYFYEIGRENYDYSITGSVFKMVGRNLSKKVGPFKISRDGILVRFPAIPANIRKQFRKTP